MRESEIGREIRSLAQLSRGNQGVIHAIHGAANESKRLLIMGLRPGSAFTLLLGPDRRGVVLDSAGTRIALGREWLDQIQVRQPSAAAKG
ncbi:ferrous iron transport protein A [Acidithiobacillus sp. IBUN Pt1247-S3]|uniref:FeoA family protein n=1 Tax=Acidithiobacillus sp. IBUN Pt1247-S3 TaxID=3166642 RepID=UPI0034E4843B